MSAQVHSDLMDWMESNLDSPGTGSVGVFHATLDDTGTCGKDGMCAVVGYVASKPQWDHFNFQWQAALDKAGIDYLHASEYLHNFPLIGGTGITDDDVAQILAPFVQVVHDVIFRPPSHIARQGFAVCVITRCDAFDSLTRDEKRFVRPPELHSFEMAVMLACSELANVLSVAEPIAIQMDESNQIARYCARYLALKEKSVWLRERIGGIAFADDKKLRPIQAADMLGHVVLRGWRNHRANKDWPVVFRNLVFPNGIQERPISHLIYGAEALKSLAAHRKEKNDLVAML